MTHTVTDSFATLYDVTKPIHAISYLFLALATCWILVPPARIEPMPLVVKVASRNYWFTRELQQDSFLSDLCTLI